MCCALSAQKEAHRARNIVLVRGAWADGRGMSLFHYHLLKHEDKGMMAKILFR